MPYPARTIGRYHCMLLLFPLKTGNVPPPKEQFGVIWEPFYDDITRAAKIRRKGWTGKAVYGKKTNDSPWYKPKWELNHYIALL